MILFGEECCYSYGVRYAILAKIMGDACHMKLIAFPEPMRMRCNDVKELGEYIVEFGACRVTSIFVTWDCQVSADT